MFRITKSSHLAIEFFSKNDYNNDLPGIKEDKRRLVTRNISKLGVKVQNMKMDFNTGSEAIDVGSGNEH